MCGFVRFSLALFHCFSYRNELDCGTTIAPHWNNGTPDTEGIAPMPTYGYTRVSTANQADNGQSLDVQQRVTEGYAASKLLAIDHFYVERGVSGSTPLCERPEGMAMLAKLSPGDVIITPKLDRMFRSSLDALGVLEQLKVRKVGLHMIDMGGDVTGDGLGKMIFTILSAVAEAERDRIRERISTVKADQKSRGLYLGGRVPLGFAVGATGMLEASDTEGGIVARAKALRATGAPLRSIQATLATEYGRNVGIATLSRALSASLPQQS